MLDCLEEVRQHLLLCYLKCLNNPLKNHCSAFPNCVDSFLEENFNQDSFNQQPDKHLTTLNAIFLNIFILGNDAKAIELLRDIRKLCGCGSNYKYNNETYILNIEIINEIARAFEKQDSGIYLIS